MKLRKTKIPTLLYVLCSLSLVCCKSVRHETDDAGNRIINTANDPKANGIKMKIYYPCSWKDVPPTEYNDEAEHSDEVIKCVGIMPENMKATMALVVGMTKLSDTVTGNMLNHLRNKLYIKDSIKVVDGSVDSG